MHITINYAENKGILALWKAGHMEKRKRGAPKKDPTTTVHIRVPIDLQQQLVDAAAAEFNRLGGYQITLNKFCARALFKAVNNDTSC